MVRVYKELEFKWQVIITINLLAAATFIIQGIVYAFLAIGLVIIIIIEVVLLLLIFFTPFYDFYIDRRNKFIILNQNFVNGANNGNSMDGNIEVFAVMSGFLATLSFFVSLFAEALAPLFERLELAFPVINFDINVFNIIDFDFFSLIKSFLSIFQFIFYIWLIMKIRRKIRKKVREKFNKDYDYFDKQFFEYTNPF